MPDQQRLLIRPATNESSKAWKETLNNNITLEHKMALVALEIDAMIDPEDALSARIANTTGETQQNFINHLRKWEQSNYASLVQEAATKTGSDPKQIVNPETRTKEQQHALLEASARRQIERMDMFFNSDYMQAAAVIDNVKSVFDDISYTGPEIDIKQEFLLYYFSTHPDIRPSTTGIFKDSDKEDLLAQYKKFESFLIGYFKDAEKAAHASPNDFIKALQAFVEKEDPAAAVKITEIPQQGYFDLPIAKAWRIQREIAKEGADGLALSVGARTISGEVIISASISGKDGKPLDITDLEIGIQRAIGNLITEANGKLPIVVSTQQIYRAFARLSPDATVTQQQADEVERIMDILMYAPSSLDFKLQLEKHKRIKKQTDYDYQSESTGKLGGPLIPAQKLEGTTRDGSRVISYRILDWPVYYRYSHIIGQIARVPNSLITGTDKKPVKETDEPEIKGTARNVAMKLNILTRIEYMITQKKQRKAYVSLIRIKEVANDCGLRITDRTKRTIRKNIAVYLDDLKAQKKIKGYSETKEGHEIVGYSCKL